jgi:pimeloyl-ACP methyl ester carboxylesterase
VPKVKVNGAELYYEISGSGPYVLQVPGAVSGHEGYAAVTPGMAEHFKVIDFDPRGYGLSDRPKQHYSFGGWAADMAGLLDALAVERAHIHGGSMGGSLAIYYAAHYPNRVDRLVVSGSSAKSDHMAKYQYEVWKALARAYGTGSRELAFDQCNKAVSRQYLDGPNGGEDLVKAVMEVTRRNVEADVFCDACDALIQMDMISELERVTAPTLVMVGDQDVLTPADQGPDGAGGRFIYDHLINSRFSEFVVIPHAGHANLMDNPEPSNRAVIEFLNRVEAQAPSGHPVADR